MTKYKEVAETIAKSIATGKYKGELMLPTENVLMAEFSVSRNTLRSAVDLLVQNGALYRVHGSGVYIRKQEYDNMVSLNSIKGISKEFEQKNVVNIVEYINLKKAGDYESKKLKCALGTPIYELKRVRIIDNVAFAIEYSLYNKEVIPYLGMEIIQGSIFNYIENDLMLKIGFADKYIVAEVLKDNDAKLLNLPLGSPAIVLDEKNYLKNGDLFNFTKIIYNYESAVLYCSAKN